MKWTYIPAYLTLTEHEEGTILAQGKAVWKLKVSDEYSGLFCFRIVFEHPSTVFAGEHQLEKVPETNK